MPTLEPATAHTVEEHFTRTAPVVHAIYAKILAAARKLGPVEEQAKKTSIHLVRKSAFAGVVARKEKLILNLKSESDVVHPRVAKRERLSAGRWHFEIRLDSPEQVDGEVAAWLTKSYLLSG